MRIYYNQPMLITLAGALVDKVEVAKDATSLLFNMPDNLVSEEYSTSASQHVYEVERDKCSKNPDDGLWYLLYPNHNGRIVRFYWRLEPMYCSAGKVYYSSMECAEFQKRSETQKVLFDSGIVQLTLELDNFHTSRDHSNWGVDFTQHIRVYKHNERVVDIEFGDRSWKKKLKNCIEGLNNETND